MNNGMRQEEGPRRQPYFARGSIQHRFEKADLFRGTHSLAQSVQPGKGFAPRRSGARGLFRIAAIGG
jgi:hypothetical protein